MHVLGPFLYKYETGHDCIRLWAVPVGKQVKQDLK